MFTNSSTEKGVGGGHRTNGQDSVLPMQRAQALPLVKELHPSHHN